MDWLNLIIIQLTSGIIPELSAIWTKTMKIININHGVTILTLALVLITIYYAWQTRILAKDSSHNVEILKNNLTEQHLIKEMDELIKPLYENRNEFEGLEYVHAFNSYDAKKFWKKIESAKYLAPKKLRNLIENYLTINDEWWCEYKKIKDCINSNRFNIDTPG
ncbi:hypothetical protein [Methanothrix soehngenii]|uniref:hypothetical protein n=1 Tax=Methanothrix soehngenii TaxID=2223 RepID=UPI002C60E2E3|nr:hypothetical protein [Methanothrix soehngenii]HOS22982.1 hypothetical protein [Methanothrix soehngenii]